MVLLLLLSVLQLQFSELFRDRTNDSVLRVTDTSGFNANQFLKIDSEFMDVTSVTADTLGISIVVFAKKNQQKHMMVRQLRLDSFIHKEDSLVTTYRSVLVE